MISITASSFSVKECALKKILAEKAELRNYNAPFFTTKTPCIPPATRSTISKIHIFHRSFMPNVIRDSWPGAGLSVFLCHFLYSVLSSFFFSIQVKSCDQDEHPFYFGWKEGWKAESRWVCPSWCWRRGSPPGDELAHRPAAGTCKLGSLRNTRLGCLQARPRLDVSVGACMCAPVRMYNEAELTGQINLNH